MGCVFNGREFKIPQYLDYWFVSFLRHVLSVSLCQILANPKPMELLMRTKVIILTLGSSDSFHNHQDCFLMDILSFEM